MRLPGSRAVGFAAKFALVLCVALFIAQHDGIDPGCMRQTAVYEREETQAAAREDFQHLARRHADQPGEPCDLKSPESAACTNASRQALHHMAGALYSYSDPKNLQYFGSRGGVHVLLQRTARGPCVFYSFGIDFDHSFDDDLVRRWGCKGFLFDPSIVMPSVLKTGSMLFFSLGLRMLEETRTQRGLHDWVYVSLPGIARLFRHRHLDVVKIDCEGCEYSVARDVAAEDPGFFQRVDQLAIEVHVGRKWMKTPRHAHYLGLLYHMLSEAGLHFVHAYIQHCILADEKQGCPIDDFYPCERQCHNYLFARMPVG